MNAQVIHITEYQIARLHKNADICPNLLTAETREVQRAFRRRVISLANTLRLYKSLRELEKQP